MVLPVIFLIVQVTIVSATCPSQQTIQAVRPQLTRPSGIFIQVSSTTGILSNLRHWLENICRQNQNPDLRLNDVVLVDVAVGHKDFSYSMAWDALDVIVPFLPGGSKACFGNVFIGTVNFEIADPYDAGIRDPAIRNLIVRSSRDVLQRFVRRYPQVNPIHWYISYESNLNLLTTDSIQSGYKDLLTTLVTVFNSIRPNGSVMWSPSFFWGWNSLDEKYKATLSNNLGNMFRDIRNAAAPGINWMNLQDSVGKAACSINGITASREDAVQWYWFLSRMSYSFASLQLNEELFYETAIGEKCGIFERPKNFQLDIEKYYGEQYVRLGAAFEIRYWRERNGN